MRPFALGHDGLWLRRTRWSISINSTKLQVRIPLGMSLLLWLTGEWLLLTKLNFLQLLSRKAGVLVGIFSITSLCL